MHCARNARRCCKEYLVALTILCNSKALLKKRVRSSHLTLPMPVAHPRTCRRNPQHALARCRPKYSIGHTWSWFAATAGSATRRTNAAMAMLSTCAFLTCLGHLGLCVLDLLAGICQHRCSFRVMPLHLYSSKQQCCRFSQKLTRQQVSWLYFPVAPQVPSGCNHADFVDVPADGVREGSGPCAEEGEETCGGGTCRAGAQAQAEKKGWAGATADARPRQVCVSNASNTRGRLYAGWTFLP